MSFITNKPTREFKAGVSLTAGEYKQLSTEGFVNGAVGDHLAGRLSISAERQFDGYFTNELNNTKWGKTRRGNWRGQLLWDAGDATTVLFNVHGGVDKSDDWYYKYLFDASAPTIFLANGSTVPNTIGPALAAAAAQAGPDIFKGLHGFSPQPYIDNIDNGTTITVDHDYKDFTLKSVTAAEILNYARTEDYGGTTLEYGWNNYGGHLKQYSEELRATSTNSGPWKWIVGAFLSYDSLDESDIYDETFNPNYVGYIFNEKYRQDTRTFALFTNNTVEIAKDLHLELGLRLSDEQKHFSGGTYIVKSDPTYAFDTCPCVVDTRLTYKEPTGKVGLDYQAGNLLYYGSVSRGYKAGGVTGLFVTDVGAKAPYNPEFINAYELGLKSDWLDKKLRVNLAAFYYDYKDLQAFGAISNEFRIFNVSKSKIDGGEIEINAVPVKDLRIDLGIGLLSTQVLESNLPAVPVGNRLGNSPNFELDLRPSYTFHTEGGSSLKTAVEVNFRGATQYYVQNDPRQIQGGYWLFSPRVTYTDASGRWDVALWAKNAGDKRYFREIFNDAAAVVGFPAPPRVIGLTFNYHWD